jgi:hypothetical protein
MSRIPIAAHSAAAATFSETLASLPESFGPATAAEPATVVTVDGDGGWPAEAAQAIRGGARAVIVVDPLVVEAAEVRELATLADASGAFVELAEQYAGDPALAVHRQDLLDHIETLGVLVVTETTPALRRENAVLGVLRTLRALGQQVRLTDVWETPTAVLTRGSAGAIVVEGAVSRGTVPIGQRVQGLGTGRTVDVTLLGRATARPASITVATMAGELRLPTVYETAPRATWRRVHAALENRRHDNAALQAFADDVDAVRPL